MYVVLAARQSNVNQQIWNLFKKKKGLSKKISTARIHRYHEVEENGQDKNHILKNVHSINMLQVNVSKCANIRLHITFASSHLFAPTLFVAFSWHHIIFPISPFLSLVGVICVGAATALKLVAYFIVLYTQTEILLHCCSTIQYFNDSRVHFNKVWIGFCHSFNLSACSCRFLCAFVSVR